jgi:hypothetical protein
MEVFFSKHKQPIAAKLFQIILRRRTVGVGWRCFRVLFALLLLNIEKKQKGS